MAGFSENNQSGNSDFSIMIHTPTPVSVAAQQKGNAFILWPNPANEKDIIDLKQPAAVGIFDLSGRELKQTSLPADQHSLTTTELLPGAYVIRA